MKSASTYFDRLRSRVRLGITAEALGWVAAAAVVFVIVSYAADRGFRLERGFRVAFLIGFGAVLATVFVRKWLRPARVELSDDELALAVERQDQGIRQALISAVQFDRDLTKDGVAGESNAMRTRVVADTEARLSQIEFGRAIDRRRIARFTLSLAAAVVLIGSWFVVAPGEAGLWAQRNLFLRDTAWPRATLLAFDQVDPNEAIRVAERDDITLRVRATGVVPDTVTMHAAFAGGESVDRSMEQIGDDVFSVTLETLLEDVTLYATGGDGITEEIRIQLVPRPHLADLGLEIHFPTYLAREPEQVTDSSGDVRVPAGSEVVVTARSDKRLQSASLVYGEDSTRVEATVSDGDGMAITARFRPEASGTLTLDALDEDRLGPALAPRVYLRVVPDEAPRVEFRSLGIGSLITAEAKIPGTLEVRDDNGLASVTAWFQVTDAVPVEATVDAGTEEPVEPEAPIFESAPVTGLETFEIGTDDYATNTLFDLVTLTAPPHAAGTPAPPRIRPGHLIALEFRATDSFEPTAHQGTSERMHFRVVTADELLEELRRRQAEQRRELERALAQEKALRDEVAEAPLPGSDPAQTEAHAAKLLALARRQQTVGRRVAAVGDRYRQILDEFENNRLFEPNVTRSKHAKIVSPLATLAATEFPDSSAATAACAEQPDEGLRSSTVASYGRIISQIERVLAEMERTEDIAAFVEALRIVIKTEQQAAELVQKNRDASVEGLFNEPGESGNSRKEK